MGRRQQQQQQKWEDGDNNRERMTKNSTGTTKMMGLTIMNTWDDIQHPALATNTSPWVIFFSFLSFLSFFSFVLTDAPCRCCSLFFFFPFY
jgi:hypothetical protein